MRSSYCRTASAWAASDCARAVVVGAAGASGKSSVAVRGTGASQGLTTTPSSLDGAAACRMPGYHAAPNVAQ